MAIVIFANAKSGNAQAQQLLALSSDDVCVYPFDPSSIQKDIKDRVKPGDCVIAAGGDGSVSLLAAALHRSGLSQAGVPLGVVPLGTGNDMARSLGLPLDKPVGYWVEAFRRWQTEFTPLKLPLWSYHAQLFINYISFGIDADILQRVDEWRQALPRNAVITQGLYGVAGLQALASTITGDTWVQTNNDTISLTGKSGIIFANIASYAGGSPIDTGIQGLSRLTMVPLDRSIDLIRLLAKRLPFMEHDLHERWVQDVTIGGEALSVQIDGEVGRYAPGQINCVGRVPLLKIKAE